MQVSERCFILLLSQGLARARSGSSIQVYDPKGNFAESVNGLDFAGCIALNPKIRGGFGNSNNPVGLLSFTY